MSSIDIQKMQAFEAKQHATGRIFDFGIDKGEVYISKYYDIPSRETVIIPDFVSHIICEDGLFNGCEYVRQVKSGSNLHGLLDSLFRGIDCPELAVNMDTTNIVNMKGMFSKSYIHKLKFGDNFDTSSVHNTEFMFYKCVVNSIDFGNKFITKNTKNMSSMFAYSNILYLDLGDNFDTYNVKSFNSMFEGCTIYELNLEDKFSLNGADQIGLMNMFSNSDFGKVDFGKSFKLKNVLTERMFNNTYINGESVLDNKILEERGIIQ